ncbi:hypothetical protein [Alkaliphilus hydrothermalis]|uniref:DUF3139 domain-containing protein n=1 Tax=Alkaliphilus hydrothermalis TaxID=1482730 RepID=A0ABS2NKY3_9FIRM|nr:hypothetical protein [Alkaliphilus hydrothermalis]MBM7613600.1 hypothetical protein [Alkaliphilus hydrothermalis]
MKNIIASIVLSTVILGLTMMGIQLWRNNLELIKATAEKTTQLEKLQKSSVLPLQKEQLTGGEVISLIRYYSQNSEVLVEVSIDGGSYVYDVESYDRNVFYIPYDVVFEKSEFYEGQKLRKLIFAKTN